MNKCAMTHKGWTQKAQYFACLSPDSHCGSRSMSGTVAYMASAVRRPVVNAEMVAGWRAFSVDAKSQWYTYLRDQGITSTNNVLGALREEGGVLFQANGDSIYALVQR